MKKRFQTTAKLRKGVAVGSAMVLGGGVSLGDTVDKPVSLKSVGIIAARDRRYGSYDRCNANHNSKGAIRADLDESRCPPIS